MSTSSLWPEGATPRPPSDDIIDARRFAEEYLAKPAPPSYTVQLWADGKYRTVGAESDQREAVAACKILMMEESTRAEYARVLVGEDGSGNGAVVFITDREEFTEAGVLFRLNRRIFAQTWPGEAQPWIKAGGEVFAELLARIEALGKPARDDARALRRAANTRRDLLK